MSIKRILNECSELNIKLSCQQGQLKIKAPKGAVSNDLLADIKRYKDDLVSLLSQKEGASYSLSRTPKEVKQAKLSAGQQQMWFLENSSILNDKYQFYRVLHINGHVDLIILESVFKEIVRRHSALRTCFQHHNNDIEQVIIEHDSFCIELLTFDVLPEPEKLSKLENRFRNSRFDLSQDYMLKVLVVRLDKERYRIHIKTHHIATDGWSIGIIVKELVDAYTQMMHSDIAVKELPYQYIDFVHLQANEQYKNSVTRNLQFFKEYLKDAPICHGLSNEVRKKKSAYQARHFRQFLPKELMSLIGKFCQTQQISQFLLFQFLTAFVISRYSNSKDVVMGVPMANRELYDLTEVVGYFVNTVPVRTKLSTSAQIIDSLKSHQLEVFDVLEKQNVPLNKIIEQVVEERVDGVQPLVQIIFSYQNNEIPKLRFGNAHIEIQAPDNEYTDVDLTIDCSEDNEGFCVTWSYSAEILTSRLIKAMSESLERVIKQLIQNPNLAVFQLNVLSSNETKRLADELSYSSNCIVEQRCIHHVFEEQVEKSPDDIAVIFQEQTLTYRELNSKANQLAHYLRLNYGVTVGSVIGVFAPRSIEMAIIMLAIHKAGGAFLIIDPNSPQERLKYIVQDAQIAVLFCTEQSKQIIEIPSVVNLLIDELWLMNSNHQSLALQPITNVNIDVQLLNQHSLAYIIYTSGSTGQPKGVMVDHKNLVNYVAVNSSQYCMPLLEGSLIFTSMNFDLTLPSFYIPLSNGLFVEFVGNDGVLDPRVKDVMTSCSSRLIRLTPSHLKMLFDLIEQDITANHVFVIGGETLESNLTQKVATRWFNSVFFNHYGPSESTIGCTIYQIEDNIDFTKPSVPIGYPMPNTSIYILDSDQQLTPFGVVGELYIGGAGVARGYLNNELLTKEKFIDNPFITNNSDVNPRLYKTGDFARFLPNGAIEFVGRIDEQLKIRGYRIELGEIESKLSGFDEIESAVVLLSNKTESGQLKAYIKPVLSLSHNLQAQFTEKILLKLSKSLPEYMVPQSVVIVDTWPLNANGKLDKRSLEQLRAVGTSKNFVAPRNQIEKDLVDICAELLNIPPDSVNMSESFFTLGGHSLLTIRLMTEAKKRCGLHFNVEQIFNAASLTELVDSAYKQPLAPNEHQQIVPLMNRGNRLPLSFSQQRIWLLDKLQGGSVEYNMPLVFRLEGNIDLPRFTQIISAIIERHEVLRTSFVEQKGEIIQVVRAMEEVNFQIDESDFSLVSEAELDEKLKYCIIEKVAKPFNLEKDLMVRTSFIHTSTSSGILIFNMHHIATDGWSGEVLTKEFMALYSAFYNGLGNPLKPLKIQYGDYALWQREQLKGENIERQLNYWVKQLDGAPSVHNLPLSSPRKQTQDIEGEKLSQLYCPEVAKSILSLAKKYRLTPFMMLHGATCLLLSKHCNTHDIVVGTPVANRMHADLNALIGFFVNTCVLRVSTDFKDLNEFLSNLRETHLNALANQDAPFEKVVERLNVPRNNGYSPIFQIMVKTTPKFGIEDHNVLDKFALPDVSVEHFETGFTPAMFELEIDFTVGEDSIGVEWTYNKKLFSSAYIQLLNAQLMRLLEALSATENQNNVPLNSLFLHSASEAQRLIDNIFKVESQSSQEINIHELFESQVDKTPDRIALNYNGNKLTYRQLNQRANQLANYLIEQQMVNSGDLVGLYTSRSHEMIIGIIAILKCGAAYVPLDQNHPVERLKYIVQDAEVSVILGNQAITEVLAQCACTYVNLCEQGLFASCSNKNLHTESFEPNAQLPAYVIYTSGSTGKPKGVIQTHKTIVNLLSDTNKSDCPRLTLQFTPYTFDVSVQEIMSTLLSGSTLLQITQAQKDDLLALATFISVEKVEKLFVPPAALAIFAEQWSEANSQLSLNEIIVAGEKFVKSHHVTSLLNHYPNCKIYNHYGPTETHVVAKYLVRSTDNEDVPIGSAVKNCFLFVLDKKQQLVERGVIGELYVGGDNLAVGYLNQPTLTQERFIQNPIKHEKVGKLAPRLYRTGDLVRYLPNGQLAYIGRVDNQVKIRGFRVELGEIETHITNLEEVDSAIVLSKEIAGTQQLVGYIKPVNLQPIDTTKLTKRIKSELTLNLPSYMVPNIYVVVDAWPLTINGKIDQRKLPEVNAGSLVDTYVSPQTKEELVLVEVLANQLNLSVGDIGINANFFELGGHSLLVPKVMTILQNKGYKLNAPDFYQTESLEELASLITLETVSRATVDIESKVPKGTDVLTPDMFELIQLTAEQLNNIAKLAPGNVTNIKDILPLLPLQQGLLFQHLVNPDSDPFWQNIFLKISQNHLPLLIESINEVVMRHDALRSIYIPLMPMAISVVLRAHQAKVEYHDLNDYESPLEQLKSFPANMSLESSPPIKLVIGLIDGDDNCYVKIVSHHLMLDEVGASIVLKETLELMEGNGEILTAPSPYKMVLSHAVEQAKSVKAEQFFRDKFNGYLNASTVVGINQRSFSHKILAKEGYFDTNLGYAVRESARQLGTSPAVFYHSAFAILMSILSNSDDTVFGSVHSGRQLAPMGSENAVGMFINTVPMRVNTKVDSVVGFVKHLAKEVPAYLPYENCPIKTVMSYLGLDLAEPLINGVINFRRSVTSLSKSNMFEVLTEEDMMGASSPLIVAISDDSDRFYINIKVDDRLPVNSIWNLFNAICVSLQSDICGKTDNATQHLKSLIKQQYFATNWKASASRTTIEFNHVVNLLSTLWWEIFHIDINTQKDTIEMFNQVKRKELLRAIESALSIDVDEGLLVLNSNFDDQAKFITTLFCDSELKEEKMNASVQEFGEI